MNRNETNLTGQLKYFVAYHECMIFEQTSWVQTLFFQLSADYVTRNETEIFDAASFVT